MNEKILSFKDSNLYAEDIKILETNEWISDHIINFYCEYLQHRICKDRRDILFVPPLTTQCLRHLQAKETNATHLDKLHAESNSYIFFPMNDNNNNTVAGGGSHWSLLLFSKNEKTFYYFDSMYYVASSKNARDLCKQLAPYFDVPPIFSAKTCLAQNDGFNCGIHVLCYMEELTKLLSPKKVFARIEIDFLKNVTLAKINTMRSDILVVIATIRVEQVANGVVQQEPPERHGSKYNVPVDEKIPQSSPQPDISNDNVQPHHSKDNVPMDTVQEIPDSKGKRPSVTEKIEKFIKSNATNKRQSSKTTGGAAAKRTKKDEKVNVNRNGKATNIRNNNDNQRIGNMKTTNVGNAKMSKESESKNVNPPVSRKSKFSESSPQPGSSKDVDVDEQEQIPELKKEFGKHENQRFAPTCFEYKYVSTSLNSIFYNDKVKPETENVFHKDKATTAKTNQKLKELFTTASIEMTTSLVQSAHRYYALVYDTIFTQSEKQIRRLFYYDKKRPKKQKKETDDEEESDTLLPEKFRKKPKMIKNILINKSTARQEKPYENTLPLDRIRDCFRDTARQRQRLKRSIPVPLFDELIYDVKKEGIKIQNAFNRGTKTYETNLYNNLQLMYKRLRMAFKYILNKQIDDNVIGDEYTEAKKRNGYIVYKTLQHLFYDQQYEEEKGKNNKKNAKRKRKNHKPEPQQNLIRAQLITFVKEILRPFDFDVATDGKGVFNEVYHRTNYYRYIPALIRLQRYVEEQKIEDCAILKNLFGIGRVIGNLAVRSPQMDTTSIYSSNA